MKHLKKFEHFILPDHTESDDQDYIDYTKKMRSSKVKDDELDMDEVEADDELDDNFSEEDHGLNERRKASKKKSEDCEEGDEDCEPKGGLSAKQKKLPLALQKSILRRKSKK